MKLTCGFHSIEQYQAYADCGAEALYCGYVPFSWLQKHGNLFPLNRREVLFYNVQLGSETELEILSDLAAARRIPVSITFNSPYYPPALYPEIAELLQTCMRHDLRQFILADPGLISYLRETGFSGGVSITLSGETGLNNHHALERFRSLGISRVIFPRFTSLQDLREMIRADRASHPDHPIEYEAFLLNELCPFQGAYCSSLHCDELEPVCRLPYRAAPRDRSSDASALRTRIRTGETAAFGSGGCGICALWRLRELGITHLKLVSRGNYTDYTCRDLQNAAALLKLAEQCTSEAEYLSRMKALPFAARCSGTCYYPEYLQKF